MNIFLARNNVQAGPYSLEQVNQMLAEGQVALDDLMWHEGMDNWHTVAEMTKGELFYRPTITPTVSVSQQTTISDDDYIINNRPEDFAKNNEKKSDNSTVWDKYNSHNPHKDKSDKITKVTVVKRNKSFQGMDISQARRKLPLASVNNRILAKLIDTILLNLPMAIIYLNINPKSNVEELVKMSSSMNFSPQNLEKFNALLSTSIPPQILTVSMVLLFVILMLQLFLLLKRGQTVGKLALGIRILNINSNAIPDFWHLIFLRSILTTFAYSISLIGLLILGVEIFMMVTDPNRQSLHDKIAKTYVVKVDDTQNTPLELQPDA